MLDNQGRKFVQERMGNGPTNTTNYYHNIEESNKNIINITYSFILNYLGEKD
jgi:hypothetical protein